MVNAGYSYDVSTDIMEYEWNEFKTKYNKVYESDGEVNLRQKYYLENRYNIMKHNAKITHHKGLNSDDTPSFKLGLNEYCKFIFSRLFSLSIQIVNFSIST